MKKVVIDAGHGGSDPGASGNGIIEKNWTLQISKYIHERLDKLGIDNILDRSSDETLEPADRVARIKNYYGNGSDVLLVANHVNAGGGDGAEVIYALRNKDTFAKIVAENLKATGQNFRKYYQRPATNDPSKDYYYILRETANMEAAIIEYGFLDSKGDDVEQLKNNWMQMGEATVKSIAEYLGAKYYPPTVSSGYIVQKGDSLYSIAKKFNTTVDELKTLNKLTSNLIHIGQSLQIPGGGSVEPSNPPSANVYHTVVLGDSLYNIAKYYKTSVDELKRLNGLTSDIIHIGQKLLIFKGTSETLPNNKYIVKSGDTLYSIASRYNVSVKELMKVNNLTSTVLNIGQELIIPTEDQKPEIPENVEHIVQRGDTLYDLAIKYNTSVEAIKILNNLKSDILQVGQILLIPSSTSFIHTVKNGDTLYDLAKTYGTTVNEIMKINNLHTTALSVGQKLIIPIK